MAASDLAVDCERKTEIAVGGGKVRVEVERPLEFLRRLVGVPHQEGRQSLARDAPMGRYRRVRPPGHARRRRLLHIVAPIRRQPR